MLRAVCRTMVPRTLRLTTIPSTSGPPIGDLENVNDQRRRRGRVPLEILGLACVFRHFTPNYVLLDNPSSDSTTFICAVPFTKPSFFPYLTSDQTCKILDSTSYLNSHETTIRLLGRQIPSTLILLWKTFTKCNLSCVVCSTWNVRLELTY